MFVVAWVLVWFGVSALTMVLAGVMVEVKAKAEVLVGV